MGTKSTMKNPLVILSDTYIIYDVNLSMAAVYILAWLDKPKQASKHKLAIAIHMSMSYSGHGTYRMLETVSKIKGT
jgi:hypothetical protein